MQTRAILARSLLGAIFVCLVGSSPSQATSYTAVFDKVWSVVDENFYDPTFHGVDWKAEGARYRAELTEVRDDRTFLILMNKMLRELKVSHVDLDPPDSSHAREVGIGISTTDINGTPTVTDIAPLSDGRRSGLMIGDRLEGGLKQVYGPAGSTAVLQVKGCHGESRTIKVERGARLQPHEHPGWRWSRMSFGPHRTIGYLRVDRFDDGAADLADQAMTQLRDTDALIIDVRNNSGGNVTALRLAGYFMPPGEAPAVALFARPYLKSLGRAPTAADVMSGPKIEGAYTDAAVFKAVADHQGQAVFYTEALDGKRYTRPTIVLIGEATGSAAEGFAWEMRLHSKAQFVGRKTAGALLSGEEFPVGEGWTLTIPVQGLWGPDGRDFADQAVSPDVAINWTRADLCDGRDPDVQRAIELLSH
ncbi:MAG: S41 family peptidase [Caulobacteraceae bacterium]